MTMMMTTITMMMTVDEEDDDDLAAHCKTQSKSLIKWLFNTLQEKQAEWCLNLHMK